MSAVGRTDGLNFSLSVHSNTFGLVAKLSSLTGATENSGPDRRQEGESHHQETEHRC
jgi:hypothetical protein